MPHGPGVDNEITRRVRRELNRRSVDCSKVQVKVSYGVIYLSGEIKGNRGFMGTLKDELEIIHNILMHIPGAREIVDRDLRLMK